MQPAFRKLPAAKRRRILEAALQEFAVHDYKSANTADIAARAGISKGLLFYYFKDKRSLYLTLVRWMCEWMEQQLQIAPATAETDIFDLLAEIGAKKLPLFRRAPHMVEFCMRVFYHSGGGPGQAMDRYLLKMTDALFQKYLAGADTSRFRPGCGPREALDLLMYLADGYLHMQSMAGRPLDVDALYAHYLEWQEMVRGYLYKPAEEPQIEPGRTAAPKEDTV